MVKLLIIIFAIIHCSHQVPDSWLLIRRIIENYDTDVVRVRTVEELAERSNEHAVLDFIGLVEQYEGYKAEEYEVTTSDGYILKLHRVNGSPSSPPADGKPVVYIGNGLLGSADFLAVLGPQQALLYMLADAGYDIWTGNYRGTTYSKRHLKYSSNGDNLKFWDFSMDELGMIDLPLFIDTVLEKTNKTKLSYIGYSMGTTLSTMLLSTKPEYNAKMNIVVSIAPVVFFTPPYSPLVTSLLAVGTPVKALALAGKVYQLLPQSKLIQILGEDVCDTTLGQIFCKVFLSSVAHVNRMNTTVIPTLFNYVPAGASLFMIDHFRQFMRTERFSGYDRGTDENLAKYGSSKPPKYDVTKVTSPQALIYSEADVFSSTHDVDTLKTVFQNVVATEKIPNFNHLDYIWLDEAKVTVYPRIIKIIKEYSSE